MFGIADRIHQTRLLLGCHTYTQLAIIIRSASTSEKMKISSIVKQNTTEITLQQENYSSYIVHLAQDKIHIGLRVYL